MTRFISRKHASRKRCFNPSTLLCLLLSSPVTSQGFSSTAVPRVFQRRDIAPNPRQTQQTTFHNNHFRALRGGHRSASSSTATAVHHNNDDTSSSALWRKRGMALALAATYFSVMGAKCALPSVLPMLQHPDTGLTFPANCEPQQLMARQLTIATLAITVGKVVLGPVIDHFGGILTLQVALSILALLLTTIGSCQSFYVFAICWVFVDFIFSSCWAGCINAIHQSFEQEEWANRIGTLAAAARMGNATAFALFASVLNFFQNRMRQAWRPVFALSAVSQLFPVLLLSIFGREKILPAQDAKVKKPSIRTSLVTLRKVAKTPEFWLHLLSRSTLMVFASFLLFVPTLMSQVYGASPAFAARTGSIYALGCLLSITTGSQLYSRLPHHGKLVLLIALLGGATVSSLAQLAHVSGSWTMTAGTSAAMLFLWGFCFAIPFYIPPSLYALSRGGTESSATIADVFDIAGFGLLAAFNGYVAGLPHATPAAWIPTFQMTTGCSLVSLIALCFAVLLE